MKRVFGLAALVLLAVSLGWAQGDDAADAPPPPAPPPQDMKQGPSVIVRSEDMGMGGQMEGMRRDAMMPGGPDITMTVRRGPWEGKWWKNPELAQKLGLSDDQISKMEKIFQDHRLQLIDLHAALEKQEVLLEPMINSEHPDEQQTLRQIDKVAQARADLEKSNARMLFAIRNVLTPEQWKKLQAERDLQPAMRLRRERGFRTDGRGFRTHGPGSSTRPMAAPAPPGAPAVPPPAPAPPPGAPDKPQDQ